MVVTTRFLQASTILSVRFKKLLVTRATFVTIYFVAVLFATLLGMQGLQKELSTVVIINDLESNITKSFLIVFLFLIKFCLPSTFRMYKSIYKYHTSSYSYVTWMCYVSITSQGKRSRRKRKKSLRILVVMKVI